MSPNKEAEGSEPAPVTPGGTYSIQVCRAPPRPLFIFSCDINRPPHRPSPLGAKYTFAGPTRTEPLRNALQKSFPFASARPALMPPVGDRAALTQLRRASNRKINGNTSFIGNTSTNVSMTGSLDPGLSSLGIWSGRSQRPLLNPRKHPSQKSLREKLKAKGSIRLDLDLLV